MKTFIQYIVECIKSAFEMIREMEEEEYGS